MSKRARWPQRPFSEVVWVGHSVGYFVELAWCDLFGALLGTMLESKSTKMAGRVTDQDMSTEDRWPSRCQESASAAKKFQISFLQVVHKGRAAAIRAVNNFDGQVDKTSEIPK